MISDMPLARRKLGSQLEVSAFGLGCMTMTDFYGPADADEAIRTIHHSIELGINLVDTADVYGLGDNERLVGQALAGRRDRVVLATKFGNVIEDGKRTINGRPEYVHKACDASLDRLEVDHVDLYYLHRPDPEVPIEDTVGAMAELVTEGKVRHLGLSEASASTIRRAVTVHPIAVVQSEWSLFSRDIERQVVPTCRELGIGIVPFAPLGRGMLTGALAELADLAPDDVRRHNPRFAEDNFAHNIAQVSLVAGMARRPRLPTGADRAGMAAVPGYGRGAHPGDGAAGVAGAEPSRPRGGAGWRRAGPARGAHASGRPQCRHVVL